MNGWGLANPFGLLWGLLAVPIIAMHILRPRRIQQSVSAIFLWRKVATPVTAASPWQKLIPSWLLAAQVLTALLFGLLMARPVQETEALLSEHTVFVIDGSASMQSLDGQPSRFDQAVARASELRRQVPVGGEVSVVLAGANARAVLTHSADEGAFVEALGSLEASDGPGDFAGAFALAAGLDTVDVESRVVFISDGGVSAADLRAAPLGTQYEPVGNSATNRGITQLSVEPATDGLLVRATVAHFGGPPSSQEIRFDVDGVTVERRQVDLETGGVLNLTVSVPPGERVEAFLEGEDVLSLDNRAIAIVPQRPGIDVLVVGPDNAFLDAGLGAMAGVTVQHLEAFPDKIDSTIDVIIADRVAVPADLEDSAAGEDLPLLAIAPPGGARGVVSTTTVERPVLTLVRSDVGLIRGLDLSSVLVAEAQRVSMPEGAQVVLGAEGAPLLVTVPADPVAGVGPMTYLSFALDQSTLPLEAAFPLLLDRALADLTGLVNPPARLTVGSDLPLDPRLTAVITSPAGTSETVPPGSSYPTADRIGFWTVEQDGRTPVVVAVSTDRAESAVAPAPDLPFEVGFVEAGRQDTRGERPWLVPVLLVLLALLVIEWLLARRRVGVAPRQWQLATVLRALIGLALIVALLAPTLKRPANDVATVFLVDVSDSMGFAGRTQAIDVVRQALEDQPEGSVAGVVAFGSDARLDALVDSQIGFTGVSVQIDPSATDLASALRLGAAALPADSRRRLVLISDGRATTGDVVRETERLEAEQIPVDVLVVHPPLGNDASVAGVEAPSLARAGEKVAIKVRVEVESAGTGIVTLRREGELIGEETIELVAGENVVSFSDIASTEGVLRYQADVQVLGDEVSANDVGYAAVPVVGAETVLVVDGGGSGDSEGQAAGLVADLEAAGMTVQLVDVGRIPPIDELTRYASIVLVNVDRRDMSDGQVQALTGAVRDLGRGMVVIGGSHTYALGGYRDSDLEELLPVISEITDPLRRQTVAEVLMIDTSGSMGACHCDEEGQNGLGGGNRIDGGISKTAIARNASARAIAALEATDEVGVLSVNASDKWVLDLQASPSQADIDTGLSQLNPDGPTFVDTGLLTAAEALRKSDANLKHIIFFSDGFTEPRWLTLLAEQAADLFAEGITVSVVATGEGAAEDLRPIAEAGGGRFYPGRNLDEIPELIAEEAVVASRNFVTEGEFFPLVARSGAASQVLTESPALLGYVATTARPTARVELRIGPDEDPLLASWQTGLGRVTAWTSDGGARWAAPWNGWDQSPDFWAAVVKDTFPVVGDGAGLQAQIVNGELQLRLESATEFDGDASAVVRVATPDGESQEIILERLDGSTFAATTPVGEAGTYAIGATVSSGDEVSWSGIGLATRSYPPEYATRPVGVDPLTRIAEQTGGRVNPEPVDLFAELGTVAGVKRFDLSPWLFWFAMLAWPLAVALSRLSWRRGLVAQGAAVATTTVGELKRRLPKMSEPKLRGSLPDMKSERVPGKAPTVEPESVRPRQSAPVGPPTIKPETVPAPARKEPKSKESSPASDDDDGSTVNQLLARKRKRR